MHVITHATIGEVIKHLFSAIPYVSEEFVGFGLEDDNFKAEVILSVFDTKPPSTPEEERQQGVEIWVWFGNADESRVNLCAFTWTQTLELCHKLQDEICWGSLTPSRISDEEIQIALFRRIDITTNDIRLALKNDSDSELLRTLKRLNEEWVQLSSIIMGAASGQVTTLTGIELLVQEPLTRQ